VWLDGVAYFATGPAERKAKNLEGNPNCVLTTGCDKLGEGFDLSVEGCAVRVTNRDKLERVAAAFIGKCPEPFHFKVREGGFGSGGGVALDHVPPLAPVSCRAGEPGRTGDAGSYSDLCSIGLR
jgi:hypothetical protein